MSFLDVLRGIAQGAEKVLDAVAKIGIAVGPELTAVNPIVGTIASSLGAAVLGAEATITAPKAGAQKKDAVTAEIMLGMSLAFQLEGKQVPADLQDQIGTAIDSLIQAVNALNSIGAAVATK